VSTPPIADYALLSDCPSAALMSRAGSIDWLCFPRLDAPAVFARLLDDAAGRWFIRAAGEADTSRSYLGETFVLETTFPTADACDPTYRFLHFRESVWGLAPGLLAKSRLV
jgi:GH15 family glucan-1,4-alpha-glucosidase